MGASPADVHSQEERESATTGSPDLVEQTAARSDSPHFGGVLRAPVLRPVPRVPSDARLSHCPLDDSQRLDRLHLVDRRRYFGLFGTIVTMPPCCRRVVRRGPEWLPA